MEVDIESSWKNRLEKEFSKPYFKQLVTFVDGEYESCPDSIFPPKNQIFRAFEACPFDDVKVVILGQDPYPTRGHAHGLCFSVEQDIRPLPKSLINVFKELESDLGIKSPENGDLNHWAEQGVLLLNAIFTVREGEPLSHKKQGWEIFTDAVIQSLSEKTGVVYILWGNGAIEKAKCVDSSKNLILSSSHPSPLGAYRSFWDSKPFSRANAYLELNGDVRVDW
ncbi:MAG: uracil-DNA glycosylase [Crocinitomicaceae bacterium]|nr:uracil-DNA glycosylase [Crocinitomicaceae bacterium]